MVHLVEHPSPVAPSTKLLTAQMLAHIPLLSLEGWSPGSRRQQPFGPVVTHGHNWISIAEVELKMWIAKPGEKIDLHNHVATVYAVGSLHPEIDTGAFDSILKKAFGILRDQMVVAMDAVIEDEHQDDDGDNEVVDSHLQHLSDTLAWSLPLEPLPWLVLSKAIAIGVWQTAFDRYHHYHKELLERCAAATTVPSLQETQEILAEQEVHQCT
ncbi:hypothetical protein BDN67DRAFT_1017439 [Paxillus ammoniavirescens]|nr:hypothetical protein BDN67DRAFT_1017439 [Paxillus ammoniavirescens]